MMDAVFGAPQPTKAARSARGGDLPSTTFRLRTNPARPVLTPAAMRGIFVMFVFDAHLA